MRRVYLGSNASGKTRECLKLVHKFQDEGLIVVSNLPDFDSSKIPVDSRKESAMQHWLDLLNSKVFSPIEQISIEEIAKLICKKGDVLILDDVDSQISHYTLCIIVDMLRVNKEHDPYEDHFPDIHRLWKHVILTGYDIALPQVTSKDWTTREAFFINNDNTINKVTGGENIERLLYEIKV